MCCVCGAARASGIAVSAAAAIDVFLRAVLDEAEEARGAHVNHTTDALRSLRVASGGDGEGPSTADDILAASEAVMNVVSSAAEAVEVRTKIPPPSPVRGVCANIFRVLFFQTAEGKHRVVRVFCRFR